MTPSYQYGIVGRPQTAIPRDHNIENVIIIEMANPWLPKTVTSKLSPDRAGLTSIGGRYQSNRGHISRVDTHVLMKHVFSSHVWSPVDSEEEGRSSTMDRQMAEKESDHQHNGIPRVRADATAFCALESLSVETLITNRTQ